MLANPPGVVMAYCKAQKSLERTARSGGRRVKGLSKNPTAIVEEQRLSCHWIENAMAGEAHGDYYGIDAQPY